MAKTRISYEDGEGGTISVWRNKQTGEIARHGSMNPGFEHVEDSLRSIAFEAVEGEHSGRKKRGPHESSIRAISKLYENWQDSIDQEGGASSRADLLKASRPLDRETVRRLAPKLYAILGSQSAYWSWEEEPINWERKLGIKTSN